MLSLIKYACLKSCLGNTFENWNPYEDEELEPLSEIIKNFSSSSCSFSSMFNPPVSWTSVNEPMNDAYLQKRIMKLMWCYQGLWFTTQTVVLFSFFFFLHYTSLALLLFLLWVGGLFFFAVNDNIAVFLISESLGKKIDQKFCCIYQEAKLCRTILWQ